MRSRGGVSGQKVVGLAPGDAGYNLATGSTVIWNDTPYLLTSGRHLEAEAVMSSANTGERLLCPIRSSQHPVGARRAATGRPPEGTG
jgi:hypothetical protein